MFYGDFLFHYEHVCCVNSLKLPHRGEFNAYIPQTITENRKKKTKKKNIHKLSALALWLALIGSNYTEG